MGEAPRLGGRGLSRGGRGVSHGYQTLSGGYIFTQGRSEHPNGSAIPPTDDASDGRFGSLVTNKWLTPS